MSLASDLLADIDQIRGIQDDLGLGPFTVTARVVVYSGERVGLGIRTVTDTPLKVGGGTRNPDVRLVSSRDAVASGGLYTNTDFRVGPLTPAYAGGGVAAETLDPTPDSDTPTEVFFVLTGPGIPDGGALFRRVGSEMASATQRFLILRSTGRPAWPA